MTSSKEILNECVSPRCHKATSCINVSSRWSYRSLVTRPSLMRITSDAFRLFLYFLPWPALCFSVLYVEKPAVGLWMCVLTHMQMQADVWASDTPPEDKVITLTATSSVHVAAFASIGLHAVPLAAGGRPSVGHVHTDFRSTWRQHAAWNECHERAMGFGWRWDVSRFRGTLLIGVRTLP